VKPPFSGQHQFQFSFWDTGMTDIIFRFKKTNGDISEKVVKEINCYVKSPLHNSTVTGGFDSSNVQVFKAGKVADPDVIYQWEFARGKTVDLFKTETTGLFIDGIPESGYGTVRITDKKHFSPVDTFYYSFEDKSPPQLEFLDHGVQNGDTLICSGESFFKNIKITDPGCGIVQEILINDNSEDVKKDEIVKNFPSSLQKIKIYLKDGSRKQNDTTLMYYIKVDSGRSINDGNLQFKILVPKDSTTINTSEVHMYTSVERLDGKMLDHKIVAYVNNHEANTVVLSKANFSNDEFDVVLTKGLNEIKAVLYRNGETGPIDSKQISVEYNPDYKGGKKPVIVDVQFVNARLRGSMVVNDDSLDLRIIAYDADNIGKVKAVVADNDTLACEIDGFLWSGRIPVLSNKKIKITAVAASGQVADSSFDIVKNTKPIFTKQITQWVQLIAGEVYSEKIQAADADGDRLTYSINAAGKNVLMDSAGAVRWVTTAADINKEGVLFKYSVSDNYDIIIDSVRVIVHKDSSEVIGPVKFKTRPSDVASDIEAGLLYSYKLQFDNRPDSVSYRLITDMDSIKIQNDSLMLHPQPADTGHRKMILVATNLMGKSDTLFLDFNVHKVNTKPVIKADSLLYKNGTPGITVAGSIDSFMTFTLWIDDPDITDKNMLKTGVKSKFSNARIQLLPGIDNHYELLLFNNNNIENEDTLLVFCEDHGGLVDTLKISVLYTLKVLPVALLSPSKGEYIQSDTVMFRWNKCRVNENVDYIFQIGQSQDSAVKNITIKDTSLMQVMRKSDTYKWRIIVASGRDTANGQWQYFSLHSSTHIQFSTNAGPIKNYCFADVDTYSVKLEIKEGTGSAKRKFTAALIGKARTLQMSITSTGVLTWIPTVNDTGTYVLNVQVIDSIGNADTLQSMLSVVPASGCHISINCSDTGLYCDNAVDLYGEKKETNLIITIDRSRRSVFDTFNISVMSQGYSVNVDADSAVMVLQRPLRVIADDTLTIIARNKSGNVASVTENVIVRYNAPEKKVTIAAGSISLSEGLSKIPVLIRLDKNSIGFTKKCGFRFLVNNKKDTLKYQINSWNQSSKTTEVWVLFDTIFSAGNTACIMEYGYQLPDHSNGKLVFDTLNHFGAVYHFEGLNNKSLVVNDESAATNNGKFLSEKYSLVAGVGSGIEFKAASNNLINLQKKVVVDNVGEKTVVFESWVKILTEFESKCFFSIKLNASLKCAFSLNGGFLKAEYSFLDVDNAWKYGVGSQSALFSTINEWARMAFSLSVQSDKVSYSIYVNGVKVANGSFSSLSQSFLNNFIWSDGSSLIAGNFDNLYLDGQYDEVWISKIKRSDDWYKFSWENQKENSPLIKIENVDF
jgi:hypothetical protein